MLIKALKLYFDTFPPQKNMMDWRFLTDGFLVAYSIAIIEDTGKSREITIKMKINLKKDIFKRTCKLGTWEKPKLGRALANLEKH